MRADESLEIRFLRVSRPEEVRRPDRAGGDRRFRRRGLRAAQGPLRLPAHQPRTAKKRHRREREARAPHHAETRTRRKGCDPKTLVRRSLWDVSLCHRLSGGGAQVVPRGVAPFDATLPGYSFHWCFFMSTQPLSRKATPSSVSSARWSGKFGARRPAWLTTRWQG